MIKYTDLNITILKELPPEAIELINNQGFYDMIVHITGMLLIFSIVYLMAKA